MKIMTILGTRPEIIRLSLIIAELDKASDHVLVHTGQNYDSCLNDIFFEQLGVRSPDHWLEARGAFGEQAGLILSGCERLMAQEKPDRILILGDTNSGLSAVVAKRLGIPVYHMEAGNRCYDDRVPEEVNRRIIDHSSDVLMPYTHNSKENLMREGIPLNRIYVTGNPIYEVTARHEAEIAASPALADVGVSAGAYFLVTMHRAENVDVESRLRSLTSGLLRLHDQFGYPVIVSTHPRTRNRMQAFGMDAGDAGVRFMDPFGFFDFVQLEKNAACLISDSGTVQEECCIFGVPNVTIRDVTERPETVECGSNVLSGADADMMVGAVNRVVSSASDWQPPREYLVKNVSRTVLNILLSFRLPGSSRPRVP